ncbi:MAG TPA: hypothetical protein VGK59_12285 [Ohtaekwangia sp.]
MQHNKSSRFSGSLILASLALLVVLVVDFFTPLGIAVGVLYVVCFFLVSRESRKVILTFAAVTIFLTLLKLAVFADPETSYMAYANRGISVAAIVLLGIISLRHRKLWEELNAQRTSHIKELEEMLFVTSHKVRRPISTCLGLMQLIDNTKPVDMAELRKIIEHLKENALELDNFTRELTKFIYEIQQKNRDHESTSVETEDRLVNM